MKGITKGEWVEYRESDGELWIISGEVVVAKVCADDYSNPLNIAQSEETESNASLICTAGNLTNAGYNIEAMPQLVEALEWALKEFIKLADDGKYPEHLMESNGGNGLMPIIKALKSAKP